MSMWGVDLEERALRWLEEECCRLDTDRAKVRAKFNQIFLLLSEFGVDRVREPHVKYLKNGMWEARWKNFRMFFCQHDSDYLVVGGVVKKKAKLSPKQIKTARRWCREAIEAREEGR